MLYYSLLFIQLHLKHSHNKTLPYTPWLHIFIHYKIQSKRESMTKILATQVFLSLCCVAYAAPWINDQILDKIYNQCTPPPIQIKPMSSMSVRTPIS